jgi:transcription elongation factor Elf1
MRKTIKEVVASVSAKRGRHCDPRFDYHFVCPHCGALFCSGCYKPVPGKSGAVRCPECEGLVYFSAEPSSETVFGN